MNFVSSDCYSNDWLYKIDTYQWTLTVNSSTSFNVFNENGFGNVDSSYTYITNRTVFPALYLLSGVKIVDGTGTSSDPYQLSGN